MAVNANIETDFFTRISNLESACYANGINNGSQTPVFQGPAQTTETVYLGTQDAVTYPGWAVIAGTQVDATTLATPVVGTDDNKTLSIQDVGGHAHTVTVATGKFVVGATASRRTATFGANAGSSFTVRAYQGVWYLLDAATGITFS